MAFQKKSSATSEQALVNAASYFKKSLGELESGLNLVKGLGDKVEELQATIAGKEDKIVELDTQFAEKKRAAEVELAVNIKANQTQVIDTLLKGQGKVAIEINELNKVQSALSTLTTDFDSKLKAETAKANAIAENSYKHQKALDESSYKEREATNSAKISTLESQNAFLAEQVKMWQDALSAERQAGIERAKASAVGTINLAGSK